MIEYGNREGRYFTEWRITALEEIAAEIMAVLPEATAWKIWYDAREDFHRLSFEIEGHPYLVSYYKIFTITRDGNEDCAGEFAKKYYGRYASNLVDLFRSGRFRTWADKPQMG